MDDLHKIGSWKLVRFTDVYSSLPSSRLFVVTEQSTLITLKRLASAAATG